MQGRSRIGPRVRELRKRRGLTQERLAELTGCSVDAISSLERGKHVRTITTVARLAEALEVPIQELLRDGGRRIKSKRDWLLVILADASQFLSDADLELAIGLLTALVRSGGRHRTAR